MNATRKTHTYKLTVTLVLLFIIAVAATVTAAFYINSQKNEPDVSASVSSDFISDPSSAPSDPSVPEPYSSEAGEDQPPVSEIDQPQPGENIPQSVRAVWLTNADLADADAAKATIVSLKEDGFNSVVLSVGGDVSLIKDLCAFFAENGFFCQLVFDRIPSGEELKTVFDREDKVGAVIFPAEDAELYGITTLRACVADIDAQTAVGVYTNGAVPDHALNGIDCILAQVSTEKYADAVADASALAQRSGCVMFVSIDVTDSAMLSEKSAYAAIQTAAVGAVNYRGTVVKSLLSLTDENDPATHALISCLNGENLDYTGMKLNIIEPKERTFSTYGKVFTLRGTANPLYPLTVNGAAVTVEKNGEFTYTSELKTGHNDFAVEHNGDAVIIDAELMIDVIKSVSPADTREFDGGGFVTLTAQALTGASVTIAVNGKKYALAEQLSVDDSDGEYVSFAYLYELPEATDEKQDLGRVTFTGTFDGYTESVAGGRLYVNAKPHKDPDPVSDIPSEKVAVITVTSDHSQGENFSKTYDPRYTDNSSDPNQYFLAKGMVDTVTGESLGNGDEGNVDCYILSGGVMIHKEDCELSYTDGIKNNISSAAVAEEGKYTVFRFMTSSPVVVVPSLSPLSFEGKHPLGYSIKQFTATKAELIFTNTVAVTNILGFENNKLFSSYEWTRVSDTQYKLTLDLKKAGGFYGIKMQIDSVGHLVISFKNPASVTTADNSYGYSLKGVKIVLDAGHNGNSMSTGTYGYDRNGFEESGLNLIIARKTRDRLTALGATVLMTRDEESSDMTRAQRVEKIMTSNADLCIAIHHNGVKSTSVYGTSAYYFYPYSKDLSECIYNRMVEMYRRDIYPTGERHEKCATGCRYYPYYMTRVQELPTMLVEIGYITNKEEYYMLIRDDIQDKVADALTAGIVDYLVKQSK